MPTDEWFARRAEAVSGEVQRKGVTADLTRAVVDRAGRLVAFEPDRDDQDRVVVCCELPAFLGVDADRAASVAIDFTSRRALISGFVMASNPDAGLLLIGRSCHVSEVEGREQELVGAALAEWRLAVDALGAAGNAHIASFAAEIDRAGRGHDD